MCLAQHLAVFYICAAALAPCGYMVGIHFFQFPDAAGILVMTDGAVGAIANALGLCLIGLLLIYFAHGWLVEQTDIQELCILTATKHILKHASAIPNKIVMHQLTHFLRQFRMVQWQRMETLVGGECLQARSVGNGELCDKDTTDGE